MTLIGLSLMLNISYLSTSEQLGIVVFVAFCSFSVGIIMEKRQFAVLLESAKYLAVLSILLLVMLLLTMFSVTPLLYLT